MWQHPRTIAAESARKKTGSATKSTTENSRTSIKFSPFAVRRNPAAASEKVQMNIINCCSSPTKLNLVATRKRHAGCSRKPSRSTPKAHRSSLNTCQHISACVLHSIGLIALRVLGKTSVLVAVGQHCIVGNEFCMLFRLCSHMHLGIRRLLLLVKVSWSSRRRTLPWLMSLSKSTKLVDLD